MKTMRRIFFLSLIGFILYACAGRTGHLVGVQGRTIYYPEVPIGMVYVPGGSFNMGQNDSDVSFMHQNRNRAVSVQAFYMDQTEISNNEYRQFVFWVRDSIARELIYAYEDYENLDESDIEKFINYQDRYFDEDALEWVEYDPAERETNRQYFTLNWDRKLDYSKEDFAPVLNALYLKKTERFFKRKEFDTRKFIYRYQWINIREAAQRGRIEVIPDGYDKDGEKSEDHRELVGPPHPFQQDRLVGQDADFGYFNKLGHNNALRGHTDRSQFIIDEEIRVYPDTLCWIRDFTYSFNDPMTNMYFWHPAYDNYPVVGVTWQQARAFSVWRTQLLNNWLVENGELYVNDFRLPTEAEWERASRGDLDQSQYPWGGPYIRNDSGCFLGNFKPMRGRYFDDGGFHTVKVYSYNPNGWGLFCMAGNVAEWCETAYDESMYEFSHDLNTDYRYDALDWDPPAMKRKVIRGGSWKDIGYYLQNGTRTYEFQDTAKSYIGFRNVATHLGRGGRDFTREGGEELKSDIQLR
jgi:formylglycine-generating enzyme required for sulfatase activity